MTLHQALGSLASEVAGTPKVRRLLAEASEAAEKLESTAGEAMEKLGEVAQRGHEGSFMHPHGGHEPGPWYMCGNRVCREAAQFLEQYGAVHK